MSNTDFNALNQEFLDKATKLFSKWCGKVGHPASLICSVSIHESHRVPDEVDNSNEPMWVLHTDTREIETDIGDSFSSHARALTRALDEYEYEPQHQHELETE